MLIAAWGEGNEAKGTDGKCMEEESWTERALRKADDRGELNGRYERRRGGLKVSALKGKGETGTDRKLNKGNRTDEEIVESRSIPRTGERDEQELACVRPRDTWKILG